MVHESDTIKNKIKMLESLEIHKNIVTLSAKAAGIARETHYDWMRKDAEYAEKVNALNDTAIDWVENKLYQLIESGDTTATIFYLKSKGRQRGFNERIQLDHSGKIETDISIEDRRKILKEKLTQIADNRIDKTQP
jgi:hypothetical protein